jgi:Zn-dependent alcohol dehydrogenase
VHSKQLWLDEGNGRVQFMIFDKPATDPAARLQFIGQGIEGLLSAESSLAWEQDKESLALKLGAARYLDTNAVDAAKELTSLGGASVILATAPDSKAMSTLIDGLGVGGQLLVVGASADPISVTPVQLIMGRRSIRGWPSGTARDLKIP